jgi:hypothetical protein
MKNELKCKDHLGNEYNSIKEMVEAYGLTYSLFYARRFALGWTLEEALTIPKRANRRVHPPKLTRIKSKAEFRDHNMVEYKSINDLADAYDIPVKVLEKRLSYGWILEDALMTPANKTVNMDHLGNEYPSFGAMCDAYHMKKTTVKHRVLHLGWSIGRALTTPAKG